MTYWSSAIDDEFNVKPEYADFLADEVFIEECQPELNEAVEFYRTNNGRSRLTILDKLIADFQQKLAEQKEKSLREPSLGEWLVVMAKNGGIDKDEVLGCVVFDLMPEVEEGEVELEPLAVLPSAQGRGLSRKLIFSILKIRPETKQIRLGTAIWNTKARQVYKFLGFVEDKIEKFSVEYIYIVFSEIYWQATKTGSFCNARHWRSAVV